MTLTNLSYCFVCFSICECGHLWNMCFCGLYRLLILPNAWSSSPPLNKIRIFSINAVSSHSWLYEHCQCFLNGKTENDSTLFMNCYLNFLPLFPFPYFVLLQHIFHLFKKEVSFLFFLFLSFAGFYTPLCVVIPQCSIKCIENPFALCVFFYCWKNMIDIRKMLFDIYSQMSVLNNTLE